MWSASGFEPPALALRIASSGSFTSGFCAAGSCGARGTTGGFPAAGNGASLKAGRGTGLASEDRLPIVRGRDSDDFGGETSGGFPRAATPPGAM
jgi:hypothetical protein